MSMLKLKNGSEEEESFIKVTMLSLTRLMKENPMAVYELRECCLNRNHQFFGGIQKVLEELSLVQLSDGRIHNSIRNIVLSAIKGEGLDMTLVSPVV